MRLIQLISFILFTIFVGSANASIKVEKLNFKKNSKKGTLTIKYSGELNDYPELSVVGKSIYVSIPNSKVTNTINKAVSFSTSGKDTSLKAYQVKNNKTKIKALFPFNMQKKAEQVSLTIRENSIELTFPRTKVKALARKKVTKTKAKNKKEYLNEEYLNSLLKIQKKSKHIAKKPVKKAIEKNKVIKAKTIATDFFEDEVKTTLAAPAKASKSSISLVEYGGKFVAFLGVVLLLFYGVVTLMKKGFIKKGKLGFLNNADTISVVSQTYLAPKKSLMLIKAHKQVFLVSNTEHGIQPISEIKDVAGLFKEGEMTLSGQNFDTNLGSADEDDFIEEKVKLKEDIMQSNSESSLSSYMDVKDKVKFSDQIKKKVKSLKPLQ